MGQGVEVVGSDTLREYAGTGVCLARTAGHWCCHGDCKGAVIVIPEQRITLCVCVCVCVCVRECEYKYVCGVVHIYIVLRK